MHVEVLHLAPIGLGPAFHLDFEENVGDDDVHYEDVDLGQELLLVLVQLVGGDVAELGVLPDLVGGPGADGLTIDIDIRLLSDIKPDDGAVLENIQIISWTEAEIVSGSPWGRCSRRPCPRQPQIQPVWADRSSRPCIQELDGSWDIRE